MPPLGPLSLLLWLLPAQAPAAHVPSPLGGTGHADRPFFVFVVAGRAGERPSDRPVQARLGQRVRLYAVLRKGRGRRARYFSLAPGFKLRGRTVPARRVRSPRALGLGFQWWRVEPRQHHVTTPPPNQGNAAYSNAVLFGPHHGRWLGFDRLEYVQRRIPGARGAVLVVDRVRPSHPKVNVHGGLGTMRYRVDIRWRGRDAASAGAEAVTRYGISPHVLRVSFRAADDFIGYLTSYFNVPNVFGSAGPGRLHQTEQYQGADCADVLVGAARRAGARLPYTSASGLQRYARRVTRKMLLDRRGLTWVDGPKKGQAAHLRFGRDVRRGDLMLIDYVGFTGSPRSWDHVGALARDRGLRGWLDPKDTILHMGYLWGLSETAAGDEGPAIVQFLRFHGRYQRAIRWHQRELKSARARRHRRTAAVRQRGRRFLSPAITPSRAGPRDPGSRLPW